MPFTTEDAQDTEHRAGRCGSPRPVRSPGVMFSRRTAADLAENRLAAAVRALQRERRPFIDLTLSNPTRAGLEYPCDVLAPLSDARARCYEPAALGAADARR